MLGASKGEFVGALEVGVRLRIEEFAAGKEITNAWKLLNGESE